MMETSLDKASEMSDLPEGAVPTDYVVVVAYLDPDGADHISVITSRDSTQSHLIGMLTMGANWIMNEDPEY